MTGDQDTSRRLSALESGFVRLQETDSELVGSINQLSTDMQLMSQSMKVLADQVTIALRSHEQAATDRLEEAKKDGVREARLARMETQLKIASFIGGAIAVSLIGVIVSLTFKGV